MGRQTGISRHLVNTVGFGTQGTYRFANQELVPVVESLQFRSLTVTHLGVSVVKVRAPHH